MLMNHNLSTLAGRGRPQTGCERYRAAPGWSGEADQGSPSPIQVWGAGGGDEPESPGKASCGGAEGHNQGTVSPHFLFTSSLTQINQATA